MSLYTDTTIGCTLETIQDFIQKVFLLDPNLEPYRYSTNPKDSKVRIREFNNNTDDYPNDVVNISVKRGDLIASDTRFLNRNTIYHNRHTGARRTLTFDSIGIIVNIRGEYLNTEFLLSYLKSNFQVREGDICNASKHIMRISSYRISELRRYKQEKSERGLFSGSLSFVCNLQTGNKQQEADEEYYDEVFVEMEVIKANSSPKEIVMQINFKTEI